MVSLKHSMTRSREPDALVVLVHWLCFSQAFAYLPTPPALSLFNSAPDQAKFRRRKSSMPWLRTIRSDVLGPSLYERHPKLS
jgi:hypothetical protein